MNGNEVDSSFCPDCFEQKPCPNQQYDDDYDPCYADEDWSEENIDDLDDIEIPDIVGLIDDEEDENQVTVREEEQPRSDQRNESDMIIPTIKLNPLNDENNNNNDDNYYKENYNDSRYSSEDEENYYKYDEDDEDEDQYLRNEGYYK